MNIKKIMLMIVSFFFLSINVFAGGSGDDITYTAEYDTDYIYGDVETCGTGGPAINHRGKQKVGGITVCVYADVAKEHGGVKSCEDERMKPFYISKIIGSDGQEYTGWGCRKPKDQSIEWIKKTLYVGEGLQVEYEYSQRECKIIEGSEFGEFSKWNDCYLHVLKPGVMKIVTENKYGKDEFDTKKYYEITINARSSKVSDLDSNYYYGNVKKCPLSLTMKKFDGLNFCGTSLYNTNLSDESTTLCEDSTYSAFHLFFEAEDAASYSANGGHYEGYGCRKPKSEENIVYEKKTLYVGQGLQIADNYRYDCSIISGPGEFNKMNLCYFSSNEAGTTKIKANMSGTSTNKYYEITIMASTATISDLDDKYEYGNVSTCRIDSGKLVKFDNQYNFCGSSIPGFTYNSAYINVACENNDFDAFKLGFTAENVFFRGYACRKIKNLEDISYIKRTLRVTQTELVQSDSKCYLISGEADLDADNCNLYASKNGTVRIRAVNKSTGEATYYEYEIIGTATSNAKSLNSESSPFTGVLTCNGLFGGENSEIRKLLTNILKFIRYGGPILMLLLTIVDLIKTVTSGDDKDFKKVFNNFIKRFIAAALLFFINDIIKLLFLIVGLEYNCIIE